MPRLLSSASALFWGLQFAFLNPVLALLLVGLYGATAAQVGVVLALYNAGGFVAALTIPAIADRRHDYLGPLLLCGVTTILLAVALAFATSLPVAVVALIVLGGPAGVGVSLLFAELRHSGARPAEVIDTRAIVSFAWVAGPPIATFAMGLLGDRVILPILAGVGVLNVLTTVVLLRRRRAARRDPDSTPPAPAAAGRRASRGVLVGLVLGFVLLQSTNSAASSVMSLLVTHRLGLPLIWAGVVLGVAALLEIPALIAIGRMEGRFSNAVLIASGCVAGALYYAAVTVSTNPVELLLAQPLNAWFVAVIAGVGLTLFLELIPRPGLASGMFTNIRKVGSIAAGALVAVGSVPALGYAGVFAACAAVALVALGLLAVTRRLA